MGVRHSFLILSAAAVLFTGLHGHVFAIHPAGSDEGVHAGAKAPELTLYDIHGDIVSLAATHGDVVILNFWATWCPHCKKELKQLDGLQAEFHDRGLRVITVNTDTTAAKVREYLEKNPLGLRIALDPDSRGTRLYQVFSVPASFIIDRHGNVEYRFPGSIDWSSPRIRGILETLLEEATAPQSSPPIRFR